MQSHVTSSATAYARATTTRSSRSPRERLTSSSTVAIVPGPRDHRHGQGKDRRILGRAASRSSASVRLARVGRANSISIAIRKSRMPPAIMKAGSVMPRESRMMRPTTPMNRISRPHQHGLIDDLIAPLRRDARSRPERHRNHADRIDDRKCGGECGCDEPYVHDATTGYRLRGKRQGLDAPRRPTPAMNGAVNIDDLRRMARSRLPRVVFDYIDGGADAEADAARELARLRARHASDRATRSPRRRAACGRRCWARRSTCRFSSRPSAAAVSSFRAASASPRRRRARPAPPTSCRRSRDAAWKT